MSALPAGYPSEAFAAFAHLKTRSTLSVEDLQVLALVECYGEHFYFQLADSVDNAEAKALLRRNGQEERGHAHRVLKAIALKGGAPWTLPDAADNPFMQFAPGALQLDANLIEVLTQGEVDGDLSYQAWADAEENAEVADLLRLNGREETRHSERVGEVKRLLASA